MTGERDRLCRDLGHLFSSQQLLDDALTHRSAGKRHNERLEFLGDAVLGVIIAHQLYQRYPQAREGDLSRWRATLVRQQTLAEVARELDLGAHIALGSGELKSGGQRRDSILSDTLEAVLGAVYLDGGFARVAEVVSTLFAERLAELPAAAELKDAKTRLQEYLQGVGRALPDYRIVATSGRSHEQLITVECRVDDDGVTATDTSRRRAEQAAAGEMLQQLLDE